MVSPETPAPPLSEEMQRATDVECVVERPSRKFKQREATQLTRRLLQDPDPQQ